MLGNIQKLSTVYYIVLCMNDENIKRYNTVYQLLQATINVLLAIFNYN